MKQQEVMEKSWSEIKTALKELSQLKHQEEEKEISTLTFLRLSNLLILVLDKVGPTMTVLRKDIQGNIERVEEAYVLDPATYFSLEEILKKEIGDETSRVPGNTSKSVVWLTRSISFSLEVLKRLEKNAEMSMEQVVEEAYKCTLKPWHGWISSAAYKVALKLIPEREIFISSLLAQGQDYEGLKIDIQKLVSLLQPFLDEIHLLLRVYLLDRLKST